ncbi:MAG TPA: thermonuclease family protein [Thermoplasmata archaeon]
MSRRRRYSVLVSIAIGAAVIAAAFAATHMPTSPSSAVNEPPTAPPPPPPEASPCPRTAGLCVERNVTRVIDGDTLDVEGGLRIRLVLVDAPELNESGGPEARDYLDALCLGTRALVDEDDFQIGGDRYGRILAVVSCGGTNANAAMIASGHALPYYLYCAASEFGGAEWTGCASPPSGTCDPSYPDLCIPPPPPDLDCADIPYRNFRVLPPDPHHFDGDADGIGCET